MPAEDENIGFFKFECALNQRTDLKDQRNLPNLPT